MVAALAGTLVNGSPAQATPPVTKAQVAIGRGGAASTVDVDATRVAIDVLRHGGNAVDAAVAAAATLGVTEPFSAGLGGGGFLVFYNARTRTVHTIDGREAAPATMQENAFVDPATGLPFAFQEARVSGISVGVPGTPQTWQTALRKWGTISLRDALRPAIKVADRGFVVDQTFVNQINENLAAFSQFSSSSALYLPGGAPPAVGSTFRNPDLARTYRLLSRQGMGAFYRGELAADIVRTVQHPPVVAAPPVPWAFAIRPGTLEASDLAGYDVRTPTADPHALPRLRRVRDADPVQRRIDGGRRAQHRRELGSRRPVADPGAAPVPRSERARLRRPQPLRRRQHPARAARRTAQPEVRPRAGVPDRPGPRR